MLTPFTSPGLSLLLQSQLFAELHHFPLLCLKNLSQYETLPPASLGEGLGSPPSALRALISINSLFLGRVRTASGSIAWAATSTACFLVGKGKSGRSFDHPAVKLVPAAPPALLPWIAGMGIRRRLDSQSPQRGIAVLMGAMLVSSVAEGERVCSVKQVMLKAWPIRGFTST